MKYPIIKPAIKPNIMHEKMSNEFLVKWAPALLIKMNSLKVMTETIQIKGIRTTVE